MRGNVKTLALLALIAAVVALFVIFRDDLGKRALPPQATAPTLPAPAAPPPPATAAAPAANPAAPAAEVRPSFDVVRVSRNCTAVMAGRAAPSALVTVKAGEQEIGRVTADARGEWALVPDLPLKAGSRELSLTARVGNGPVLESASVVVVSVPSCEPGQPSGDQTIAVLSPAVGATRVDSPNVRAASPAAAPPPSQVLQLPARPAPITQIAEGLRLDTIDYDEAGNLTMAGRAQPNATVQVYVNNQPVGAPTADRNGVWTLRVGEKVPPGVYTLRVDQVQDAGRVVSRLELPFARATAAEVDLRGNSVVVQPGNSLWRIARNAYGDGLQYTTIYQANREQIRDPDLIYPGQIFAVPSGPKPN